MRMRSGFRAASLAVSSADSPAEHHGWPLLAGRALGNLPRMVQHTRGDCVGVWNGEAQADDKIEFGGRAEYASLEIAGSLKPRDVGQTPPRLMHWMRSMAWRCVPTRAGAESPTARSRLWQIAAHTVPV